MMMITIMAVMLDLRVILPSVCDVCLRFCWVSVGARKPHSRLPFLHSNKAGYDNDDDNDDNNDGSDGVHDGGSKSDPSKCLCDMCLHS